LEAARESLPPLPDRADLEKIAADLPGLWSSPATSTKDRKRLLRTLIADITLLPVPDQGKARIGMATQKSPADSRSTGAYPPAREPEGHRPRFCVPHDGGRACLHWTPQTHLRFAGAKYKPS
jgi:hypothetical protein